MVVLGAGAVKTTRGRSASGVGFARLLLLLLLLLLLRCNTAARVNY
jgi:uncharacterized integral membrane protein